MNIDRMCRVCEAINGLKDIFDEDNEELLHMLRRVADISIEKDDLLPKQICYSCENQLEMAHEFRMLCESTDKTLRARLVPQNRYIDSAFASVEPIEQYIVESKLDLDSIIVKEEYMTDDELEENVIESVDPLVTSRNEISLKEDYDSRSSEGTVLDKVDEEKFDQTSIIENPVDAHLRPIDCFEQDVKSCVRVKRKWVRREKEKIIKTFTCPVCAASFTDFPKFNTHKKTHGKYRYECPMCDRKFARTTARNLHVASVHSSTQVPCDVCGKQLASTVTLRNHIRECHGNKEKRHVCKICNKRFYRKANMRMHMNIHGDERNYACDKCPSTYKTACSLHVHKLTHKPPEERNERRKRQQNQKKPKHRLFICEHCGKQTWSHPRHLIHLRIHTGEKPYACDVCQKTFAQKPALNSHMRCHTGERPHSCHLCGMSFRQGPHLQTHIRSIHEQARPHKCQACGKAFTSAGNLRTHVRLHTGEKPFECNLCPLRFIDINGLKRHRRKEHANDIAPKKAMPSSTNDDEVLSLSALVEVVEEELDESC